MAMTHPEVAADQAADLAPDLLADADAGAAEEAADDPGQAAARPPVRSRFPAIAGFVAALWALFVGLALLSLLVLAIWVLAPDGEGGAVGAWRGVGLVWLGGHQVPLLIAGRELTLLPLGAVIPGLLVLRRAGLWAARIVSRPSLGESLSIVLAGGLLYGAAGAGIAWITSTPSTGAAPVLAGAVVGGVGVLGLSWGVGSQSGWVPTLRKWCGVGPWGVLRGGLAAFTGLYALGAALVTVMLMAQFQDVAATLASLRAGVAGELGLTLLGIAALPTMAIWAMALALGAPVSFGGSGSLGLHGGELGQLPALPVLASLPAHIPSWAGWLLFVPVVLGFLAGRIRWREDLPTIAGVAASVVGLALVVAGFTALAMRLASGSLGGQLLSNVGPAIPVAAGTAAGLVALGFLLEAGWQAVALSWELHRAEVARSSTIDLTSAVASGADHPAGSDLGPGPMGPDSAPGDPSQ